MTSEFNNVPVLGQQKLKANAQYLVSLVRHLDEDGTFEPENTQLVDGQIQAIAGRSNLVSAEDLVDMFEEMVRRVVREELKLQASK